MLKWSANWVALSLWESTCISSAWSDSRTIVCVCFGISAILNYLLWFVSSTPQSLCHQSSKTIPRNLSVQHVLILFRIFYDKSSADDLWGAMTLSYCGLRSVFIVHRRISFKKAFPKRITPGLETRLLRWET